MKQMDRLEMAMQASLYQQQGIVSADEFLASAAQVLDHPQLRELLDALQALNQSDTANQPG